MAKKKITKLTDEQYYEYIMSLKDDASLYNADGEMQVPEAIQPSNDNNTGE